MEVTAAFPHCSLCFGQIDREKVRKLASSNWKPKTGQACTMLRIWCSGSQGTLNNRQKTYPVFTRVYLCYIQLSWACKECVSHSLSNMLDFSNQLFQNYIAESYAANSCWALNAVCRHIKRHKDTVMQVSILIICLCHHCTNQLKTIICFSEDVIIDHLTPMNSIQPFCTAEHEQDALTALALSFCDNSSLCLNPKVQFHEQLMKYTF